jgi:hypothetical protein
MEPNEILKKAWEAVRDSGVPESMQDTAFKEAVAILRGEGGGAGTALPKDNPMRNRRSAPQPVGRRRARSLRGGSLNLPRRRLP